MGPVNPAWSGSAAAVGTRLEFDFPVVTADNVGCAAVDSFPQFVMRRRYYWQATASFPDSRYPNNHFMSVDANFWLPAEVQPTPARLDSALGKVRILVTEAGGEPPSDLATTRPEQWRITRQRTALGGQTAGRVRLVVEGRRAVAAFLAPGGHSVALGWCQRDQWLTWIEVPLLRR